MGPGAVAPDAEGDGTEGDGGEGERVAEGPGADGLPAAGGASGTAGGVGVPGPDRSIGTATSAATAHVRPAPAAARTVLRRAAPLRIVSNRPEGAAS
ncbi:hypothetical protein [Streptomyces montanisoli]|uniref:Uncharacterized protein n=1 Tax=Streptomyces montanisoli TaxID=2798581 RepID=A0A940RY35_9ACTN|nr:hypothetical protein [Streptomyces montanisoli]MBP0458244.1 hypothetical protein [Streptomyces montanisoli]